MSQTLSLQLSDSIFAALEQQARAAGQSPAEFAVVALEKQLNGSNGPRQVGKSSDEAEREARRGSLRRHFGAVNVPDPTGADNEAIDADLAREYADNHEEE